MPPIVKKQKTLMMDETAKALLGDDLPKIRQTLLPFVKARCFFIVPPKPPRKCLERLFSLEKRAHSKIEGVAPRQTKMQLM
ncbi:unnamed protein product [Gongylonema pulchrum]|uniref:Transposase n=1 Tax=Gongylonema pulchrum TaxID=637853 RepID=A0A183DQH5_9BILA|nr:unnamed protein product [Gongylonema pulchrum]